MKWSKACDWTVEMLTALATVSSMTRVHWSTREAFLTMYIVRGGALLVLPAAFDRRRVLTWRNHREGGGG